MTSHIVHSNILNSAATINLVGCGGNGSLMLSGLARLNHALIGLGHEGLDVTVYDPDIVSDANIGRQLFYPCDHGHSKAAVLVSRVNACFGTAWQSKRERYQTQNRRDPDILITCVDTASARTSIAREWLIASNRAVYWLDLGNRAADGQVVLGARLQHGAKPQARKNDALLPNVLTLYPEIAKGNLPDDDAPSCSLAEALDRQQLFINQHIATEALELLWRMFRFGKLDWHAVYVNLNPRSIARRAVGPAKKGKK
jgi:PRTRC genetic system ThiF family protein